MPAYVADLHNHSPYVHGYHGPSDTSARQIVEAAIEAGIDVFAITDHSSYGFVAPMIAAAAEVREETGQELLIIPGVELRIAYGDDEVHISPLFSQEEYLESCRMLFDFVGLEPESIPAEQVPSLTVEFDPVDVCRRVLELGGVSIISHADRYFGEYAVIDSSIFERLIDERAVAGIEMLDQENCNLLYGYDIAALGSSDSHSLEEIGTRRTMLSMRELTFAELKRALYRGSTVCLTAEAPRLPTAD